LQDETKDERRRKQIPFNSATDPCKMKQKMKEEENKFLSTLQQILAR